MQTNFDEQKIADIVHTVNELALDLTAKTVDILATGEDVKDYFGRIQEHAVATVNEIENITARDRELIWAVSMIWYTCIAVPAARSVVEKIDSTAENIVQELIGALASRN